MNRITRWLAGAVLVAWLAPTFAAEQYQWPPVSAEDPLGVVILEVRSGELVVQRGPERPNRRPVPKHLKLAGDAQIEGLPPGKSLRTRLPVMADILALVPGETPDSVVVTRLRVRDTIDPEILKDAVKK